MGIQSKSLTSSHSPDLLHCYLRKTYYFVPVAFRGDLKYLTQCFNFVRNTSTSANQFEKWYWALGLDYSAV